MKLFRFIPVIAITGWLAACGGGADVTDDPNDLDGSGGSAGAGADGNGTGSNGSGTGGSLDSGDGGSGSNSCEPKTCKELKKDCGPVADGCGDVVDCGECGSGEECGLEEANKCTTIADLCQPQSKEEACAGKECGVEGDGCGDTYDCGTCGDGEACGAEAPFQCGTAIVTGPDDCPAKIESCASVGAECGVIGNGCGGTLDCEAELGGCTDGMFCGLGGPQKCGDTLDTCQPADPAVACAGKCGLVSNGCGAEVDGGLIDCTALFPCPDGQACGASGTPGVCGSAENACVPLDKATACGARTCGKVSDGCEGSYDCGANAGACDAGAICKQGSCELVCTKTDQATACAGKECGQVGDGCSGLYDCGGCDTGETCGLKTAFQCDVGTPGQCTPMTKAEACAGKECGTVYDGCGSGVANQITCGNNNGGCTNGEYCGLNSAFQCDGVTLPTCGTSEDSCADLGWACGIAVNKCGQTFDCATEGRTCSNFQSCQGGINAPTQCVTDSSTGNCPLCNYVPSCVGQPQVTKLKGRVITPGRTNGDTGNQVGVPNAFVYILRTNDAADLPTILPGVPSNGESCDRCEDQDLGAVLASAVTDSKGEYELSGNIPVGQQFLLVVKVGKFRRASQYTLTAADSCKTKTLPFTMAGGNPTRLPRSSSDGLGVNIPHVAVSTGSADGMECVFEKMGIDHGEFTVPSGAGRIHLYRSNGAWPSQATKDTFDTTYTNAYNGAYTAQCTTCGNSSGNSNIRNNCPGCGSCSSTNNCNNCRNNYVDDCEDTADDAGDAATATLESTATYPADRLTGTNARIHEYDMVVMDCEGGGWAHQAAAEDTAVRNYVNRGGRMFASHYSRHWICDNGSTAYNAATPYVTGMTASGTFDCSGDGGSANSGTGYVSLGRTGVNTAKLQDFADWLVNESAATLTAGRYQFGITDPRDLASAVGTYSEEFVYRETGASTTSVQQFSFNTPYGAPDDAICGRVAYSGFHVSGGSASAVFPNHCTGSLSAQEKVLLYSLFDLGACVGDEPDPPGCTEVACAAGSCGVQPDGCGKTQDCGGCSNGQVCSNNQCVTPGCTATTCQAEGATCGVISNGCGGTIDCGPCPSCTPIDQATACSGLCGYVSDGCGSVYECPDCEGGLACTAGACQTGSCTPLTACPNGMNCGYISDGCDGVVNCGTCQLPEVCGAGGAENVCGVPECNPLTCDDLGATCGLIGDGCGDTVDCGTCGPGQACGIGGTPNQCSGCEPLDCNAVGAECGAIGDGCGAVVQCGDCPSGQSCGAIEPNKCGNGNCTPITCEDAGAACGVIGDGCGDTLDCGVCPTGQLCGIDTPFQCGDIPECVPTTCKAAGAQCGAIGDGCGKSLDCGVCPTGSECGIAQANKCTAIDIK